MNNNSKKVLVIDDEKMNIMALAFFLKTQYEIIVATDGISGLEAAQKHIPDIILLDIMMPGLSGFDVITKLKESDTTKNIPVIFISALDEDGDEDKGLSLGAVDFITKPFRKLMVERRVETQLKLAEYERILGIGQN